MCANSLCRVIRAEGGLTQRQHTDRAGEGRVVTDEEGGFGNLFWGDSQIIS